MKKLFLIPVYFVLCSGVSFAQEVISSAGEHFESSSGSASWTIGETIILTLEGDENAVTQGFHQPAIIPTMSQRGIIISGFILLIIGVVALNNVDIVNSNPLTNPRLIKSTNANDISS